jgi:glycosyltransferase involved in cell wall biosynthesis
VSVTTDLSRTASPRADARARPIRLAVVVAQPIQHFGPFYRAIAERGIDPRVLFTSRAGLDSYFDPGFGATIQWGSSITEGYEHEFVLPPGATGTRRSAPFSIARRLERLRPDCVLIHGYSHAAALAALAWSRRRGVPTLMFGDSELLTPRLARVRVAKQLALRPTLAAVSAFLTIGDNNEDYLAHYGVARSRMYRMPIPTDEAPLREVLRDRATVRRDVRAELGIADDTLLALFVGKLVPRKRPRDLAAALRIARDDYVGGSPAASAGASSANGAKPPMTVLLAGDGELRHALEVDAAGLDGWLIVTTDLVGSVGPSDDVQPGRNGAVYTAGDVAGLAAILTDVCHDRDRLATMAAHSSTIASQIGLDSALAALERALAGVGLDPR